MLESVIELLFAVALLTGAVGSGQWLLRRIGFITANMAESISFAAAAGCGMLILAVTGLGLMRLLYVQTVWLLTGCGVVAGSFFVARSRWLCIRRGYTMPRIGAHPVYLTVSVLLLLTLSFALVRALAPPHGATDPLAYQLALPRIYLANGYLSFERSINGALYPSNAGMLFLVGLALRNGVLSQVINWSIGVLTCLAILGFCRRHFTWRSGVWGAAIFATMPVVMVLSGLAYVDLVLCFFQFMAFYALANWLAGDGRSALLAAAVATGLAMGTKHQGISTVVLGGGIVIIGDLLQRRGLRAAVTDLGQYAGIAVLLAAPWYARAWVVAGNPLWPLANGFFGGLAYAQIPTVMGGVRTSEESTGMWAYVVGTVAWLRHYWHSWSPWHWTFAPPGWQKSVGPFFLALLPGLFLVRRDRKVLALSAGCIVFFLMLLRGLHMNPRYGLVLFAYLAVLCGVAAERLMDSRVRMVRSACAVILLTAITLQATWAFAMARPLFSVVFGAQSREQFLISHEGAYRAMRFINSRVPQSATVLLQGVVKGFYCDRRYIWDHSHPGVITYADYETPEELLARLRELGITHILRMINIPPSRLDFFPQYFQDPFHEEFRQRYLRLLYRDESYAVFSVGDGE